MSARRLALLLIVVVGCGDDSVDGSGGTTGDSGLETSGSTDADGPSVDLPPRASERSCRFEGNPPGLLPQLRFEPAFEGLQLEAPVAVTSAPGRPDTLWVAERDGRILSIDRVTEEVRSVVELELEAQTTLEAIAFPPDFVDSGHVFVRTHRAANPPVTRISRLALDELDAWVPDETMMVLGVPFAPGARAGGAMLFDAAGMLIVALGDGGAGDDLPMGAQDPSSRHGSILRIDPAPLDATGAYGIPADNPRADDPAGATAEAWAWGVRDPKQCSVDRLAGDLWCADVGELEQEVGRVPAGGNLGWPILDGRRCRTTAAQCDGLATVIPYATYGQDAGDCEVVGGVVYRGSSFPELQGAYLYADRCSGRVRGLRLRADGTVEHDEVLGGIDGTPVAFGEDPDGELFLVDGDSGALLRVALTDVDKEFPVRLSASGCFDELASLAPAPDLVPFEVNAPLWSDGTLKYRHFVLPPGEIIAVLDEGLLAFPVGTYLLKTFVLEQVVGDPESRIPLETRVMIQREHGWEFHSYRWDDDGSDATLLARGDEAFVTIQETAGSRELHYVFPDRFACRTCHGSAPSHALGPRIDQLDRRVDTSEGHYDQLEQLDAIGMFDRAPPAVKAIASPSDAAASLEQRARAYLHGNCGHCHRPGGWVPPDLHMDLRWGLPLEETRTCGVPPQYFNPWADGSARIAAGDPDDSLIWQRIDQRGPGQMPPLGTTHADPGADVVREWIASLAGCD